ncbi:hypothetical protein, partial [Mesorhizobium sp.]|uniref:hypothetical protein n=1 Tax=Mesorhizobium sp. TaxID=1871066 RepID=UPI002580338D
ESVLQDRCNPDFFNTIHPGRPYKAFQATKSIQHRAWLGRAISSRSALVVRMARFTMSSH